LFALQSAVFGAISLIYEEGPDCGTSPALGTEITIKLGNFDVGTQYPVPTPTTGYSGLPYASNPAGVSAGVSALDGIQTVGTPGQQGLGTVPGANGLYDEDTWGIFRITRIEDPLGYALWTPAVKGQQLNTIFYGEQDFFVEMLDGANTRIDGFGMHIDIYSGNLLMDGTGGTGARAGPAGGSPTSYPTVNAEGQTLELSLISLPGFINGVGVGGGLATEFESRFNFTSLSGEGDVYLEITGGASAALFDGDMWGVPDYVAMDAANAAILGPLGYDTRADIWLAFEADPAIVADWLVESDDPMKTFIAGIPEPITMLGLVFGLGGVGAYIRRRRQG
jgi:hypothetical protein